MYQAYWEWRRDPYLDCPNYHGPDLYRTHLCRRNRDTFIDSLLKIIELVLFAGEGPRRGRRYRKREISSRRRATNVHSDELVEEEGHVKLQFMGVPIADIAPVTPAVKSCVGSKVEDEILQEIGRKIAKDNGHLFREIQPEHTNLKMFLRTMEERKTEFAPLEAVFSKSSLAECLMRISPDMSGGRLARA